MPQWSTAAHSPNASAAWSESFYYTPVNSLPLKSDSSTLISNTSSYHTDRGQKLNGSASYIHLITFGTDDWENGGAGGNASNYFSDVWPTGVTPSRTNWSISVPEASTPNPHLYFADLRQELASAIAFFFTYTYSVATFGDRHAVLWSESTNELVEAIGYNGFSAACESIVTWDLSSYTLGLGSGGAPAGVVAAKIPIAPFHFTYNDLQNPKADGTLGHMLGWIAANYQSGNIWPARGNDGELGSGYLKAGDVIRLRSDYPVSSLPNEPLKVFARTLQKYGMLLYDKNTRIIDPSTSGQANIVPPNDPSWPQGNNDLGKLLADSIKISDFEVVDTSSIAGSTNSIRISNISNASISINAVASGEIVSSPSIIVSQPPINTNAISSSEIVSSPTVKIGVPPIVANAISSLESISSPVIKVGVPPIVTTGITSSQSVSSPKINVYLPPILANSILSQQSISLPKVNVYLPPIISNSITSSQILGSPSVVVKVPPILATGIDSNETISLLTVVNGDQTIYLDINSIDSDESFGYIELYLPIDLYIDGISSNESIGNIGLYVQGLSFDIQPNSIVSSENVVTSLNIIFNDNPVTILKDTFDVTIVVNDDFDVVLIDNNNATVVSIGELQIVQSQTDINTVHMN